MIQHNVIIVQEQEKIYQMSNVQSNHNVRCISAYYSIVYPLSKRRVTKRRKG